MEFLTQIETDEGDSTIASLSVWSPIKQEYLILAMCTNLDVANLIVKAFKACQEESNESVLRLIDKAISQVESAVA
jgi:hypothetical protein